MSRLFITKIGELELVGGIVTEVKEGTGGGAGKVTNVKIKDKVWNFETKDEEERVINIAFWNNDQQMGMPLTERIKKALVHPGVYITALVKMTDETNATGYSFKYRGAWRFAEKENQKELNVFVGVVASLDSVENRTRISIPEDNLGETIWHSITFWNNEKERKADSAKICLSPRSNGQKMLAVVVAGEKKLYNDKNTYTGFKFELLPECVQSKKDKETKDECAVS